MNRGRAERPLVGRTVWLYLLGIVLPAIGVLLLAWRSIEQQRMAIDALTERNLRLTLERLANIVDGRVAQASAACARDEALDALGRDEHGDPGASRRDADAIRRRHPVAAHVFVVRGGVARYPPGRTPLLADVGDVASRPGAFRALFAEADALEGSGNGDARAASLYRQAAAQPVAPTLRALALSRLARCERRLGHAGEADAVWARLAADYADERDLAFQPYGLIAAVERSSDTPTATATRAMRQAYDDLVNGRWPLSADQVEYFLPLLEHRLGLAAAMRPRTEFLLEQPFALALGEAAPSLGSAPGEVVWTTIGPAPGYALALASNGDGVRGCAVALDWVRVHVVPSATRSLGFDPALTVALEPRVPAPGDAPALASQGLPLALSGYRVAVRGTVPERLGGAWAFAGATVVTMGALAMGVFLLLRDVARQGETTRLREDLVSGVSHELKTPLTLIRVYAETLEADPGAPEGERVSYSRVIVRECERLAGLIERVLSFSRMDRGERAYRIEPADLAAAVRDTTSAYADFLRGRGFAVTVSVDDSLSAVPCDRDAISEALVNLIDNAAKYSDDARDIAVALRRGEGDTAVIEVADRGVGIAPRELDRVFDRYYRAEQVTGRGGYGLGLFLVKHTAEAHGGRVEAISTPGAGSRFRIVLPLGS